VSLQIGVDKEVGVGWLPVRRDALGHGSGRYATERLLAREAVGKRPAVRAL
jgi:hypothetical protein